MWIAILIILLIVLHKLLCRKTSKYMGNRNVFVVLSKYDEDTSWVSKLPYPFAIYSKSPIDKNYINLGTDSEASTYLHYIIENYDDLHEWTLFIHAHETHWHHPTSVIKSCEIDLDSLGEEFISINHDFHNNTDNILIAEYDKDNMTPEELTVDEYQQVFIDIFGKEEYNKVVEKYFSKEGYIYSQKYPMSAQFYVHKSRILSRPKYFYQHCLEKLVDRRYVLSRKPKTTKYTNRRIGAFFMEANWHYIFGEDYIYQPKFLKYSEYFSI